MTTRVGATSDRAALGKPEIRRLLLDFVKRRVPAADVDDVVQTILVDALAAAEVPSDHAELRKWVVGIARHKVADFHRKSKREAPVEAPEPEAPPAPLEARELVGWAERQAAKAPGAARGPAGARAAKQTLDWMAREGEGEKLENIAADENVPAARVRQRVSRLRRWMKERWLAELAAVAALAVLAVVAWWLLRGPKEAPEAEIRPDRPVPSVEPAPPEPTPLEQAQKLRAEALGLCEQEEWDRCVRGLDDAARLDPAGDQAPAVVDARARAAAAKELQAPPDSKNAPTPEKEKLAPESTSAPAPRPPTTSRPPAPKAPPNTTTPAPTKPGPPSKKQMKSEVESSFDSSIELGKGGKLSSSGSTRSSSGDFPQKKGK